MVCHTQLHGGEDTETTASRTPSITSSDTDGDLESSQHRPMLGSVALSGGSEPVKDKVRFNVDEGEDGESSVRVEVGSCREGSRQWTGGEMSFSTAITDSYRSSHHDATDTWFCPDQLGRKRVVVMGSGDFGLALTSRLVQANYSVIVASRNPSRTRKRVSDLGATMMHQEEALQQSNVVVVAVPFQHAASLPLQQLVGKILIDVSNRDPKKKQTSEMSQAEKLQALVPSAKVVKAFNVLSAYAITRGIQAGREVPVCGECEVARGVVCKMGREMRMNMVDMGRLVNAREVEEIPLRFFPEWKGAFITSVVIWLFIFLLSLFDWQLCENLRRMSQHNATNWTDMAILTTDNLPVASGSTSLILLALCYLPGVIAAYLQLYRGTKYSEFPSWLDKWLKSRKQLGLLMLLHAFLHTVIEVSGNQLANMYEWKDSAYIACGSIALVLASLLGLTSLPSVSSSMTWREFTFVQSVLGWVALIFSIFHIIFNRWESLITPTFTCYMPPVDQTLMVIPMVTVILKLPLLLPCVNSRLTKIRQGYDRPSAQTRTEPAESEA